VADLKRMAFQVVKHATGFENNGDHAELLLLRERGLDSAFRRSPTWSQPTANSS
jgi:hypothetical protein